MDSKAASPPTDSPTMASTGLVVVTGASSGIGAATTEAFIRSGYKVLAMARRKDRLSSLAAELQAKYPDKPSLLTRCVDVTEASTFRNAIEEAEEAFGTKVDLLVNNAGCMLLGDIKDQHAKEWRQMLDVNVVGVLNGIQAVLSPMMERKRGTIINVSSIAGFKAFPNHAVYSGTKFAVHGITETVRLETAKAGLRHILISPGVVSTELLGHTTSEEIKTGYEDWKQTMGHPLAPMDVAKVILFAYEQPQSVCLREIVIGPTYQEP